MCALPICRSHHNSRKMRSSVVRSRLSHHGSGNNWSHVKAEMSARKLRSAVNLNNLEAAERLLENGADPSTTDEHSRTPLHFAAAKGYTDMVRLLLSQGANPNAKDTLGNTALHLAACTNHVGVVTQLLRAGTNVRELDNNGRTPLNLAQSKLKLLQNRNESNQEMDSIKNEVAQVLEMMREYLSKTGKLGTPAGPPGSGNAAAVSDILDSFTRRLTLHQTKDDMNSDLQTLLDSLGNMQVSS